MKHASSHSRLVLNVRLQIIRVLNLRFIDYKFHNKNIEKSCCVKKVFPHRTTTYALHRLRSLMNCIVGGCGKDKGQLTM